MAFITSNGLTESETSRTVQAGGMTVHYHDIGTGEPVLFLHSYGPGTTAWITFHKTVGALSQHFRCILMDLPNFSKTGPIVYREGVHAVQARTAVALLDALGIPRGARHSHAREHPPVPARAHRRRGAGHRRAGGLHPSGAHLVARVRRGAAAVSERAARLHAGAGRHPGARALDSRTL